MLVGRVIHIAANGLLLVLLTRFLLSPDEYGLLMLAISVLTVCQLFSDLGLGKSAARYLTEYRESERGQVPHILRRAFGIRTLTIVVTAVTVFAAAGLLTDVIGEQALGPLLGVGVLYLAANSYRGFTSVVFQGFNHVHWSALVQITNSVGRLVFALVFIVVFGLGAAGALLGYVAGAAVAALLASAVLYTKFYRDYEPAPEAEEGLTRRIVEYSVPLTVTRSAGVINGKVDMILIGYYMTSGAVGLYALGKQIVSFSLVPAGSLGFAVSPTYGEQKANDELDTAARLYEQTLRYTLLLYIPAAVGLILVARPTVTLIFGSAYAGAVPVVQIFGLYLVVQALVQITTDGLDYLGRARTRAIAKGTTAAGNAVLNVALIPPFGIAGAAAATVVTTTIYAALNVYVVHSEMSLRTGALARATGGILAVAGVMGGVVFAALPYVSGLVSLFGVVALGVVVWACAAVLLGLLDPAVVYRTLGIGRSEPDVSE